MTPAELKAAREALGHSMTVEEMIVALVAEGYRVTPPKTDMKERFWGKVMRGEGCWLWTAGKDRKGYGLFKHAGTHRTTGAHRVAWELTHGAIGAGMLVMHSCDNPACVNPEHLRLGTNADNMNDKVTKGRQAKGADAISVAKLNPEQVLLIRAGGKTAAAFARDFQVSEATIRLVRNGTTWRHVK